MRRSWLAAIALVTATALLLAACGGPTGSGPASTAPGGVAGPVGAWTMTLTPDDLRAAGVTEPAGIAENAGTYTFTLGADGVYTMAQDAEQPVRWPVFRGTWSAPAADQVELRTTFPPDYAGEVILLRWARDATGLRLQVLAPQDPVLDAQHETRPWAPLP